jgi:hypothetical protein
MHINPKVSFENAARQLAGPQMKLRTDRKLPVLYYILYGYVFPHTNHYHGIVKFRPGRLVCWCQLSRMPRRRLFWNLLGTTSVNMAVMDFFVIYFISKNTMLNIRPETTPGVYLCSIQSRVLKRVTGFTILRQVKRVLKRVKPVTLRLVLKTGWSTKRETCIGPCMSMCVWHTHTSLARSRSTISDLLLEYSIKLLSWAERN